MSLHLNINNNSNKQTKNATNKNYKQTNDCVSF